MKNKNLILLLFGAILTATSSGHCQTPFTKITSGAIVNDLGAYAGIAWADFHNDGLLDLFIANYETLDTGIPLTNVFYRNNGSGNFTSIGKAIPSRTPITTSRLLLPITTTTATSICWSPQGFRRPRPAITCSTITTETGP
jgi:hypothetical protein